VEISARVAQSLSAITEKAREMHSIVSEIANASEEQNKGIGQLTTAVQEMDRVTQTNASSAEEPPHASEETERRSLHLLRDSVAELASPFGSGNAKALAPSLSDGNSLKGQPPRKAPKHAHEKIRLVSNAVSKSSSSSQGHQGLFLPLNV
jgi:hypothetical protein